MKKFLLSAVLGLTLAAVPSAIYAACADVITYDLGTHIRQSGYLSLITGNG